ncbi:MAG: alpha/beta hydrolase [Betaproteobacteria bacterium]|jgi:acetyl esterase/lipase
MSNAFAQTLSFNDILDRTPRPTPTDKVSYGPHADQYAELWLPDACVALLPVVILIHGGCWRADLPGPELVAFLSQAIAQQGVAVCSVTYRRVGTETGTKAGTKAGTNAGTNAQAFSPYPDTFLDVAAAADKLREIAPHYKLDLNRVVTIGHSAGGHLALWLAARPKLPTSSRLVTPHPLTIHAAVGIAALADLQYAKSASAHACGADTVDLLINTKERKDAAYLDTSVTPLLPLGLPQTLISGASDSIVAPAHALRYHEHAKAKGETVTLLTLEDAGHFELIAPWTPPGARVVETIVYVVKGCK